MYQSLIDLFRSHVWWQWDATSADTFSIGYHLFNLAESAVWFGVSIAILIRAARFRHSRWEWLYASAFFVFGLTDVVEAWQQSSLLIAFKLFNLVLLGFIRHRAMKIWYPKSRYF